MKAPIIISFLGCLLVATLLPPARAAMAPLPSANRGLVYDYIATPAFGEGAKKFYVDAIASDANRQKLIAQAKDECGGRYEGTAVNLVQLSQVIDVEKNPPEHPGRSYTLYYLTEANAHWLLVETISCSILDGHAQSLLHAVFLSGTETERVTYHFVGDNQVGKPAVSDVKRVYKIDADTLTDQYNTPYSLQ